jgi:hypothetical protein
MKTTNTTKRGRRGATNNRRSMAVSAATMGKALAILATSCAAFQSSPTACRIGAGGTGLLRTHDQHCTVALHYRYGSDIDQLPIRMQAATNDSAETTDRQSGRRIVSVPQLTFLRRPVDDDQQSVMDDYLEYVDRRYSRIHGTTAGSSSSRRRRPGVVLDFQLPRKIFSTATMVTTTSPQALAKLNALGLTDLASDRLRQRLQAPRDLRDEFTAASYLLDYLPSPSFEAAFATHMQRASPAPAPVVTGSTTTVAQPEVGGRISSFANVGPVAQYQLMVQTLRKFLQAFVTSMKIIGNFASRVIPEILEKGGFRHSVRMMSVATLALLFMCKPLFKGAMKG